MSQPTFSRDTVALHNKPDDMWILIDHAVYDVTQFQFEHPGGPKLLKGVAGRDATKSFHKHHNEHLLSRYGELKIGEVATDVAEGKKVVSMLSRVLGWRRQGATERHWIGSGSAVVGDGGRDTF